MKYLLFDAKLRVACGPVANMTAEQALIANRDLYLDGKCNLGWIPATVPAVAKVGTAGTAELIAALRKLGCTASEAKAMAAKAPPGTVEEQIRAVFS